ncbi:uncharacterized protein METZ01_LOCUS191286 [marine metagenome]|uniref:Bifunctional riboflavin kinase/FMN adenylyltransferase n=1 Tax=marine metagenome TaxID=408172 RepID=A0A382DK84_9ZZZZ
MKIYNINLDTQINEKLFHLAIGNFDGIHLGHKVIISKLIEDAKKNDKPSAILSFNPHPRLFFSRQPDKYQIISEKHKQNILEKLGVDYYFSLFFDKSIANLAPSEFIEKIIVNKLKINKLVVGYDFHFGKNRKGDIFLLKDYSAIHGFLLEVIDPIKENNTKEIYSSSAIRSAIGSGDIETANIMLGYKWIMGGVVVHGDKKAREMNFPTANFLPHEQVYPAKGVYAVQTLINDHQYKGVANFGERPTVGGKKLLFEVHLFDFDQDIYGKHLTVEFLTFIRGEKKFDSFALLAEQIKKDIQTAKDYHLNK